MELAEDIFSKEKVYQNLEIVDFLEGYYDTQIKDENYENALWSLNIIVDYKVFSSLEHDSAYDYCLKFNPHINSCKNLKEVAKYYINYAEAQSYSQRYRESISTLKEGIARIEKHQDSSLFEYGYMYLKSGENNTKINNFLNGIEYFNKAKIIFTHQKDTLYLLWTQNGLSHLFSQNGLYEEAEENRKIIYRLGKNPKYKHVLTLTHLMASNDAFSQENDSLELYHVDQAVLSNLNAPEVDIAKIVDILTYSFATRTYARLQQLKKSNYYLKKTEENLEQIKNNPFLKTYYTFGKSYNAFAHQNYNLVKAEIKGLIPDLKNANEASNLLQAEHLLAKTHEKEEAYELSLIHYKNYLSIKDSLRKEASNKKFAYVKTELDVAKKDLEISEQKSNIKLLSAKNKLQDQWTIFGGTTLILSFVFFMVLRSRNFAKKKAVMQQGFTQNIIKQIETERKRISSELHDGIGQKLALIKKQVKQYDNANLQSLSETSLEELRGVTQGLHPAILQQLGLTYAIQNIINEADKNSSIFFTSKLDDIDSFFSSEDSLQLYRIVQELINNVVKHSKAKSVNVEISYDAKKQAIALMVIDDGIGFKEEDLQKKSLGLSIIQERVNILNGTFKIHHRTKGIKSEIKIDFHEV